MASVMLQIGHNSLVQRMLVFSAIDRQLAHACPLSQLLQGLSLE